jgi:RNA polymerase sigma-70 factor (ECF subfamily)
MSATDPTHQGADEPRVRTLGALLYAGCGSQLTTESVCLALVRSIAEGDQVALRDLYVRMHRLVFTLIVRIVQDRGTAEELTLDVFHDVWRRASSYEEAGGTVVGWILNQARSLRQQLGPQVPSP